MVSGLLGSTSGCGRACGRPAGCAEQDDLNASTAITAALSVDRHVFQFSSIFAAMSADQVHDDRRW
jgi:hypothetical protein